MKEQSNEELIRKNIRINKIKIWADVILIIVFLVIAIYIFKEIELFKTLSQDVCRMCMEKTGATCFKP
jgi:cytosine/uracil/thiamine/allantoin permease